MPPVPAGHPVAHPAAVLPATHTEVSVGVEPVLEPLWRLVLLDDDDHTYDYVIEMLGAVFGYAVEKAFALARIVDTHGRVTLMTAARGECEAKQQQVHAYGADPRIPASKGSMTAILEPAETPTA